MKFYINQATEKDAKLIAQLGAETFTEAFGQLYAHEDLVAFLKEAHRTQIYRAMITSNSHAVWKAVSETGDAIGYGVAGPLSLPVKNASNRALELKRLYVKSGFQSQGLGDRLMTTFFAWAEQYGYPELYLGVYAENYAAQRFYQRHGFQKVGDYLFPVGRHRDLEFIYKRMPV